MLNIPKENVKAFITIVGGLAVLIIIALIIDINFIHRNVFYEPEPDMTIYSNTPESKVEENKYNIVSEKRRILYYTDEIMEMINNKEFDKLFNILDEEYRNSYMGSVSALEKYMERLGDAEYNLVYNKYFKDGNKFLIDVRFEKSDLNREDIINGVSYPSDTLCITEMEKGKYTVAFNGFIEKKETNKGKSNELIKVNVKEIIYNSDSTEILIDIENLTDEKLTLYDERLDIYIVNSGGFKYINTGTLSRDILPMAKRTFKVKFKGIYRNDSTARNLIFKKIYGADGNVKKLEIKL